MGAVGAGVGEGDGVGVMSAVGVGVMAAAVGRGVSSASGLGAGSLAEEKSRDCVCLPAAPSTVRPWSRWKASTALIVPP